MPVKVTTKEDEYPFESYTIFKRGSKGEMRQWRKELGVDEDAWHYCSRTVSGTVEGKQAISGWSVAYPKNVGKANETTSLTQAISEIEADYAKKLRTGYFKDSYMVDQVKFTKPMLATAWEKRKDKIKSLNGAIAQPKLDGIRCIARKDGLWTRTGKKITSCPHIEKELSPVFEKMPNLVLDGELYNHDLRDNFNTITSIVRKVEPSQQDVDRARNLIEYHIYDMVCNEDFQWRAATLFGVLRQFRFVNKGGVITSDYIKRVETIDGSWEEGLDRMYARWIEEGYEGQMIRLNATYENKRSNNLMKRKDFITDEFQVIRVEEGQGNWAGYAKRFTFLLSDGQKCGAGVRGNQEQLRALLTQPKPDWCTVRYFTPTPDGMPRFPVVVDWGWGKRSD